MKTISIERKKLASLVTFFTNVDKRAGESNKYASFIATSCAVYLETGDYNVLNTVIVSAKLLNRVRFVKPILAQVASHRLDKKTGLYGGKQGKAKQLDDDKVIAIVQRAMDSDAEAMMPKEPKPFDLPKQQQALIKKVELLCDNGMTPDQIIGLIRAKVATPQPVAQTAS